MSDVSPRPAAPPPTPGVCSPQVRSVSIQGPTILPSAQAPPLPSRSSSEPKCTTANPVQDKDSDATSLPKCTQSHQWQRSPWLLSSPLQHWHPFTGSLADPRGSGTAAALQQEAASVSPDQHHSSAPLQVHAWSWMHSAPETRSAGVGKIGSFAAATAAVAPTLSQGQGRGQQHSSCSLQCAPLHTTAGLMSIPSSPKALPQAPDSAEPKPAAAQSRQPPTPQQDSGSSQAGSHGVGEADRDCGSQAVDADKIVLYKGRYMRMFRMLVRFKIFQLVGIAALAVPINTFLAEGSVSAIQMVIATSLIIGCGVASTTLWWFSQRYVGEMSLVMPDKLCFSVLDFWGNRQDTVVNIDRLIPPMQRMSHTEKAELIHQTMFPLDVSADRQYLISLRHGVLVDRPKLEEILTQGRRKGCKTNGV